MYQSVNLEKLAEKKESAGPLNAQVKVLVDADFLVEAQPGNYLTDMQRIDESKQAGSLIRGKSLGYSQQGEAITAEDRAKIEKAYSQDLLGAAALLCMFAIPKSHVLISDDLHVRARFVKKGGEIYLVSRTQNLPVAIRDKASFEVLPTSTYFGEIVTIHQLTDEGFRLLPTVLASNDHMKALLTAPHRGANLSPPLIPIDHINQMLTQAVVKHYQESPPPAIIALKLFCKEKYRENVKAISLDEFFVFLETQGIKDVQRDFFIGAAMMMYKRQPVSLQGMAQVLKDQNIFILFANILFSARPQDVPYQRFQKDNEADLLDSVITLQAKIKGDIDALPDQKAEGAQNRTTFKTSGKVEGVPNTVNKESVQDEQDEQDVEPPKIFTGKRPGRS